MSLAFRVREIESENEAEIALVAERMRLTLIEVVGEKEGAEMYSMDWLIDRVEQHLEPTRLDGAVFVAEGTAGQVVGHTIVRVETEADGTPFGLFSTFYVTPESRKLGIARAFVEHGESWMRERSLTRAATYTAEDNSKLHELMRGLGYEIVLRKDQMVAFSKNL